MTTRRGHSKRKRKDTKQREHQVMVSESRSSELAAAQQPTANDSSSAGEVSPSGHSLSRQLSKRMSDTFIHTVDVVASLLAAIFSFAVIYVAMKWTFVVVIRIEEVSFTFIVLKSLFFLAEATLFAKFVLDKLRSDGY